MLNGGTNCGKGGTTMAAVHGPGDHWWRRVWSGRTTCGADNLRRDNAHIGSHVCMHAYKRIAHGFRTDIMHHTHITGSFAGSAYCQYEGARDQ